MFQTPQDILEFALAGNATLTLESQKTGVHFTYKIRQARDSNDQPQRRWFVSLLTGPDNENSYSYLGLLDQKLEGICFRLTKGSKAGEDALSVKGFRFFWNAVYNANKMPCQMHVHHEGHCGRCGRKLTVPESIDSGIGPECAKRMAA